MDCNNQKPIGFFDTGIGGISVLKEAIKLMPNENFVYFGDSKNAPYGTRPIEEVRELTFEAVEFLLSKGVKAIVIACNTATSVAINELRERYTIPIIGIEPALKPAIEENKGGKILVMATPVTLAEEKFSQLVKKYAKEVEIVPLPCAGLVEIIEEGNLEGEKLNKFIQYKFKELNEKKIDSIVLGCTHYPFIKKELSNVVGDDVSLIDGSFGTSKELKRQLDKVNILNNNKDKGWVKVYNSADNENLIELSYKLINS